MEDAPSRSSPSVACSICGDALRPTDRFCGSCGALVTAVSSVEEPAHSLWAGVSDRLQTATLGEFQIIRELGRGGMAAVFLAHDIHLDRKVAIKVMSPTLVNDASMVERFRREAKTGAGLKHPNISTVHRVLEGEGLYFFVMDFVRGRPLDAIIQRNGVLSVAVARALLHQIGSGLAYAHRRKIYHRDVKPANVIVSAADGTAVVTDFGIAKVAESPTQTQTGAVVGTPAYMAPEQIFGREITAAVDQYALGIMAFEMLTGAPPFIGTNYVVMHAHTAIEPRSLRDVRPECPTELADAVARMLAKEPADRFPSLPHALAALGATPVSEDDPIREELIRLATPDDVEQTRFATNTPHSPPPSANRGPSVAMVAISLPPEKIEVGDAFQLQASPRDIRGDMIPGVFVEWATSDASILSVQSDGSVTAVGVGSAEISATAGRARSAVLLSVEPSRVSSLQVSIPPGMLIAGEQIQLAARAIDKHQRALGYAVRWAVGDPNVARVSPDGVLEARAAGTVEVYAESDGVRTVARVQIAPPPVASIRLAEPPASVVAGSTVKLSAAALDAKGNALAGRRIHWSAADTALVTINDDGVMTALAAGDARVTASCEGKTASATVTIKPLPIQAPVGYSASAIFAPVAPPVAAPGAVPGAVPKRRSSVPKPASGASAEPAAPDGGRRRWLVASAGILAAVLIVVAITRWPSRDAAGTKPDSTVAQTGDTVPALVPPVSAPAPIEKPSAAPVTPTPATTATRPAAKGETSAPRARDAFRIVVAPVPPLHVGDSVTWRATVERTGGAGAIPPLAWQSSRSGVVNINPTSGFATAASEGQTVITATAGNARVDVGVTVLPAVVVAPAAPVAVAPPPVRIPAASPPANPPQTRETRPAGPTPEEIRARGADALRDAANALVAALKAKNVALATQLFGDGRNDDANDMLATAKDRYGFTVALTQVGQPQVTDRTGVVDYQVTASWVSAAGPTRTRVATIRAEAERSGDAWRVVRQRITGGWR